MASQMGLLISIVIVTLIVINGFNAAVIYTVGDDFGWNIPPNTTFYSEWAKSKIFQIGDIVKFNVTLSNQSMGELSNLTEYNSCTHPGLELRGPSLVYSANLTSNGSRFFVSGVEDHCKRGMKVIITVGSPTDISPEFISSSRILTSPSLGSFLATALSTIVIAFLNYV